MYIRKNELVYIISAIEHHSVSTVYKAKSGIAAIAGSRSDQRMSVSYKADTLVVDLLTVSKRNRI
jgi:hypothetical protein